jgi:hypothetical protein
VRHQHDAARVVGESRFQPLDARKIEVIGRLVEPRREWLHDDAGYCGSTEEAIDRQAVATAQAACVGCGGASSYARLSSGGCMSFSGAD